VGWSALLQAFVLDAQDAGPCLLFDFDDEDIKPSSEKNLQTIENKSRV
jgi:hypothetical protein